MNSAIYETRTHRFNQYKNTLRKTITEAKKIYFSNQFDHPVTDVLDIWSTVHIIAIHCHRIVNFDFDIQITEIHSEYLT